MKLDCLKLFRVYYDKKNAFVEDFLEISLVGSLNMQVSKFS